MACPRLAGHTAAGPPWGSHPPCAQAYFTGARVCYPPPVRLTSSPPPHPTQAHFTEHMLFYSSEKYPKEDEYRCASWSD